MSNPYQGNPANITTPLAATITDATNATPIVVTTTTDHGYSTGDQVAITGVTGNTNANSPGTVGATISGATNATPIVITTSADHGLDSQTRVTISGVTGNTAANGGWTITKLTATTFSLNGSVGSGGYVSGGVVKVDSWTITVLSTTTFSLNGSAGNAGYVSGGVAKDNSLTPPFQLPSNGGAFVADAWNVGLQMAADREQFMWNAMRVAISGYTIADIVYASGDATGLIDLINGGATTQSIALLSSSIPTISGDIVLSMFSVSLTFTTPNGGAACQLQAKLQADQNGAGAADVPGSVAQVSTAYSSGIVTQVIQRLTLPGLLVVIGPGTLALSARLDLTSSATADHVISTPSTQYSAVCAVLRRAS